MHSHPVGVRSVETVIATQGLELQQAWVQVGSAVSWSVFVWCAGAAIFALLLLPIVGRVVRRRHFWCERAGGQVEVEFEESGVMGFRRPVAVRSCSLFDPPNAVTCGRSCLTREVRLRLPMTLPRPWRRMS